MSDQRSIYNNPLLRGLEKKAQLAVQDIEEEYKYIQSLKRYRDNYAILTTERNEGFDEGYAEGFVEAYAKVITEGRTKGVTNVIKRMFSNGMKISKIASITGYSSECIEKLIK